MKQNETQTITVEVTKGVTKESIEIVQELSYGLRSREIGHKMEISPRTVEAKIDELRHDYGCSTQAHLVAVFLRNKLIQ